MKVAIVHDYIKEYGGAERVLEALHEVFPDAPVFTLVYLPDFLGPHKARFEEWDIRPSFLQNIPFKSKLISPFRLIAPFVFKSFNFSDFDCIIVSATGAYSPNYITKKRAIQVCYYHTPPRYLYGFATAREWKKNGVFRVLGELANHFLRLVDYKSVQNVDLAIANSKNVRSRIQKFYKKDAVVVYPPIEINSKFEIRNSELKNRGSYFLAGGRLARPKHIDLIVRTFSEIKFPLMVFGKEFAGYGEELRNMAGKNIKFLGEITDEEKVELMRNAKAYVFAAEDEDFGITPVEAQSVGTPVIAYASGGVLETVSAGKTGVFFKEVNPESLKKAVEKMNKQEFDKAYIARHAQKFRSMRFKKEIKRLVGRALKNK